MRRTRHGGVERLCNTNRTREDQAGSFNHILIVILFFITLVSSCALARLSTAMAKKTFSRVSSHSRVKDVVKVVTRKPCLTLADTTVSPW